MDQSAILTSGLSKRYGSARGILDLDLEVRSGEIFGFLGPNGAGKTTTIRLLLDLIRPTAGSATLLGMDSRRQGMAIRGQVGYLPGEFNLYGNLSGQQLLRYLGSLRGGVEEARVSSLAQRLEADLSRPLRELSHGSRQKVALLQALMSDPPLLILDEPTSGLDPLVQQVVYALLDEARARGRTVFFSSHVLSEVERVCDRVGMVRQGHLIAIEDVNELRQRALRRVEMRFDRDIGPGHFAGLAGIEDLRVDGRQVSCAVAGSMHPLVEAAAAHGCVDLVSNQPGLQELFLSMYGDEGDAA